jgi:acyl-CoA thioester hydrolase
MREHLDDFPVVIDVPVAWGEMDAFRHVNNIVYFRYFESARMECFVRIGLVALRDRTGVGPILASTSCRFRFPLTYPDVVAVGTCIDEVGEDRFLMRYRVVSHTLRKVAADGEGLVVTYDYTRSSKVRIPEELRAAIASLSTDRV